MKPSSLYARWQEVNAIQLRTSEYPLGGKSIPFPAYSVSLFDAILVGKTGIHLKYEECHRSGRV